MSKIWSTIIVLSITFALLMGFGDKILEYITSACKNSIENILTLAAMTCFWTGIFNIIKGTCLIDKIAKIFKKIFIKIFKRDEIDDDICNDISLNVASNIIGAGNAATSYGINAITKMQKLNRNKDKPNDSMTTFILLNTASIQLIPATIISLRTIYGSNNPTSIIIPVWIATGASLMVGLILIKVLNKVIK